MNYTTIIYIIILATFLLFMGLLLKYIINEKKRDKSSNEITYDSILISNNTKI